MVILSRLRVTMFSFSRTEPCLLENKSLVRFLLRRFSRNFNGTSDNKRLEIYFIEFLPRGGGGGNLSEILRISDIAFPRDLLPRARKFERRMLSWWKPCLWRLYDTSLTFNRYDATTHAQAPEKAPPLSLSLFLSSVSFPLFPPLRLCILCFVYYILYFIL